MSEEGNAKGTKPGSGVGMGEEGRGGWSMIRVLHTRLVLPHETGAQDLSEVFWVWGMIPVLGI